MKKVILICALSLALFLGSCASAAEPETTVSKTTAKTQTVTRSTTASVETTDVTTKPATKETKATKAAKPTEPTEKPTKKKAAKPTKPVPTQGKTKPNTHIVVTFPKGSFSDSDLVFTKGDIRLKLGESWKSALKKLKTEGDVIEISSKRTEHDYSNFTVTTLINEDEEEIVEKIEIVDDTLETPKGIKIGSFASRLRKVYGDPYKKNDTAYRYGDDEKMLVFTYEDNMVDGIYYKINL